MRPHKMMDEEEDMKIDETDDDTVAQKNVLQEIMKMADDSESDMLREDPRDDVESSLMEDDPSKTLESGGGGKGGGMGGMDPEMLKKMKGMMGGG